MAATTTSKQGELDDWLTGYQIVLGFDYVLSDSLLVGVKDRWVRLDRLVEEGIVGERCAVTRPSCGSTGANLSYPVFGRTTRSRSPLASVGKRRTF